jgi:arylesterase/paraoxonase
MKTWLRGLGWTLAGLVALFMIVIFDFLRHGGQFKSLKPQFAGTCTAIPLAASAEDIQIDRVRGVAYLSYLDRRGQIEGKRVLGTVMLLDLNVPEPRPRPALSNDPPNFRPHGMSLYRAGDGSQRLFTISHLPDGEQAIEVFEQTPTGAFAPIRTIRDPLLLKPNAVVAVGPNQFYVANDSGARGKLQRATELLFRRGLSTIAYFDGQKMRAVATGLKSASGIAVSPDASRIYVSETSGNRLAVYARNAGTGDLSFVEHVELGSAPDNLSVEGDGTVWIAAHAKVLALARHFGDANKRSPTQVFRWRPGTGTASANGARPEVIYLNLGDQLSAGSGAVTFRDQLLIGSITEHKVLQCRLPPG